MSPPPAHNIRPTQPHTDLTEPYGTRNRWAAVRSRLPRLPVTVLTGISAAHHSFASVGETKARGTATAKITTADTRSPRLDLGSGTGMGTFALLERFEVAYAAALDISPRFKAQGPDGLLAITEMDFFPRFLPDQSAWATPGSKHASMPL